MNFAFFSAAKRPLRAAYGVALAKITTLTDAASHLRRMKFTIRKVRTARNEDWDEQLNDTGTPIKTTPTT